VDQVDFVKESKQLEEYIQKLSLNQPIMQPLPAAGAGGYGGGRTPGAQGGDQISVPCHIYILIALSLSRISSYTRRLFTLGSRPAVVCVLPGCGLLLLSRRAL
jgi:hypothetical protein